MKLKAFFSSLWTPRRAAAWEKIRSKGKVNFVLVRGMLLFGGWMIVFTTLLHSFIQPGHFIWRDFITALFIWPIGGIFWGVITWNSTEAGYRSYQSRCELEQLEASQPTSTSFFHSRGKD